MTELAVARNDVTTRADLYEDLLTLFFSSPNVGGVILKGFWDRERIATNQALVEGADFVVIFNSLTTHSERDHWISTCSCELNKPSFLQTLVVLNRRLFYFLPGLLHCSQENEAGRRVRDLWKTRWTTREVIRPETHSYQVHDLRGFYGDYDVIVRHNGDVIKQQSFTLSPGKSIDIYMDVYPLYE